MKDFEIKYILPSQKRGIEYSLLVIRVDFKYLISRTEILDMYYCYGYIESCGASMYTEL